MSLRLLALSMVASFTSVAAQLTSMPVNGALPPTLIADFGTGPTYAFLMHLAPSASTDVSAFVSFSNAESPYAVNFDWSAARTIEGEVVRAPRVAAMETVSFMPTAICSAKTSTNVIFVAGWYERIRACVVEKWTLTAGAYAATLSPITGKYTAVFVPPTIAKSIVYLSTTGIAAVESLAHHPVSGSLVLLEYGPDGNVHQLTSSGVLSKLTDAVAYPSLSSAASIRMRAHSLLPYMIVFLNRPVWSSNYASTFLVLPDSDSDGVFEVGGITSYGLAGLVNAFPSTGWQDVQ